MKTKIIAGLLAAFALAAGSSSLKAQPTNWMAYNFDTDQVSSTPYSTVWGNWFGAYYQGAVWDSTVDASNNPASGSLQLSLLCNGHDQYVLNDGLFPAPSYSPVSFQTFSNLSFDIRYDVSSAIRTNANGTLDFGLMRVGSRGTVGPNVPQDWFINFAIPATNGLGNPNTNWVHINVDLRQVPINFSDLSAGMADIIIGMDGANFGNNVLIGSQILWLDNIQFSGFVSVIPPPTLTMRKTMPGLRLFGGNGLFGRSQLSLVDTKDGWASGNGYPVSYSFTLLGNATNPGNLDTHIQFIPLDWDTSGYQGNSGADYWAANGLWLRILSGTGTSTCVADISWKTNAAFSNPAHTDLMITNAVRAGTWTLTFNSSTSGTLTAPGAAAVPFNLSMTPADTAFNFGGASGTSGTTGMGIRFGNMNNGNTANGGVPDDWASISISGAAGTNFVANFAGSSSAQIDTNVWNLGNSDGNNLQVQVPTNAPYWVTWTTPDNGFGLVNGTSLTNWLDVANVNPLLTGGLQWGLIPSASLLPGNANYFALLKRTFSKLQILFPGETNAPGTLSGKVGTPNHVSLTPDGTCQITINAVDSTYHITHVGGDVIAIGGSDLSVGVPNPVPLANGTATATVTFTATGNFTLTATDNTNGAIPPATSSSVTVVP